MTGVQTCALPICSSGGRQAVTRIYKAKADGYSIVASAVPGIQVGQVLYNPAYDLAKMIPVAAWIGGDMRAFTVGVDSPLKTWADVVALSKQRKLKVSGTGIGSVASLQSAILAEVVGIDHVYVPYESGGRSQAAVMSGEVDLAMTSGASAMTAVQSGNVRLIGFFGYEELKDFPGAYPISKDFPDAFFESSIGAYAPPGTPQEAIQKLSDAFVKAASNPEFLKLAENAGLSILVRDHAEWTKVSKNYLDLVVRTKDLMMAQMQ